MPRLLASMMRFSIWSDMPRPWRPPIALASWTSSTRSGNSRPPSATGQPSAKRTVTRSGAIGDAGIPVPHAHDRLHDVHARAELLEILGLVRRAPDVGVGRVGLLGARAVGQVARQQPFGQLAPAAELVHEVVRRATACRCAGPGSRAGRSGRSARCRCPCRSSRRPRSRRRRPASRARAACP